MTGATKRGWSGVVIGKIMPQPGLYDTQDCRVFVEGMVEIPVDHGNAMPVDQVQQLAKCKDIESSEWQRCNCQSCNPVPLCFLLRERCDKNRDEDPSLFSNGLACKEDLFLERPVFL